MDPERSQGLKLAQRYAECPEDVPEGLTEYTWDAIALGWRAAGVPFTHIAQRMATNLCRPVDADEAKERVAKALRQQDIADRVHVRVYVAKAQQAGRPPIVVERWFDGRCVLREFTHAANLTGAVRIEHHAQQFTGVGGQGIHTWIEATDATTTEE